jgi:hypothetical protein
VDCSQQRAGAGGPGLCDAALHARRRLGPVSGQPARATRRGGSRRNSKASFRDWRHIANDGFLRGSSRQKNGSGGLPILITKPRHSTAARSCEPAPTIRTPAEMGNLVSMGGWIARVACRHIPGVRCFRHRSACHYRACWISGVFACQRQGCELKNPKAPAVKRKAKEDWGR